MLKKTLAVLCIAAFCISLQGCMAPHHHGGGGGGGNPPPPQHRFVH